MSASKAFESIGPTHAQTAMETRMPSTMRIVHADVFPPFASLENGRSVGLVVEVVREAAKLAGFTVDFIAVPFEQMETALIHGLAELSIPIGVTPERAARFDFSQPLLKTGGSLFFRAGEPVFDGLTAFDGRCIVTPRTGPLAAHIARVAPAVSLILTDDYTESLQALLAGTADVAALNHHTGEMIASRLLPGRIVRSGSMFIELPFAAAALKGRHPELLKALDRGLSALSTRDSEAR